MRALFIFLILVVVMNTVKCPGCSQTFDQGIAIKAHQRTCAGLRLVGQKRINKQLQNAQKREAVKLTRIEGQSMDDIIEERRELRAGLDDNVVHYPAEIPDPQATQSSGRPARTIRLPKRYRDELPPAPPIPIPDPEPIAEQTQESPTERPELVRESSNTFRTAPDSYGVLREYLPGKPSITPDELYSLTGVRILHTSLRTPQIRLLMTRHFRRHYEHFTKLLPLLCNHFLPLFAMPQYIVS